MAKLFQAELQIVGDDKSSPTKIQAVLEKALKDLQVEGVFVREVNFAGDLEDGLEDDEENGDY